MSRNSDNVRVTISLTLFFGSIVFWIYWLWKWGTVELVLSLVHAFAILFPIAFVAFGLMDDNTFELYMSWLRRVKCSVREFFGTARDKVENIRVVKTETKE